MKSNSKIALVVLPVCLALSGLLATMAWAENVPMKQTNETPKETTAPAAKENTCCATAIPEKLKNIQRMLIVGNSLTRHGPSTEKLGWPYNWGMAATALENDYAHQLYAKICNVQKLKGRKPELKVDTMLAFAIETRKSFLDYKPDFVVLQMGDNLHKPQSNRKDFVEPYIKLIQALKKANPEAVILVVNLWGSDAKRNDLVKDVTKETGTILVDLGPLRGDKNNYALSEGNFKDGGVNWHPGNRGMAKIAEQIWTTAIKALSTPPTETEKTK